MENCAKWKVLKLGLVVHEIWVLAEVGKVGIGVGAWRDDDAWDASDDSSEEDEVDEWSV